MSCKQRITIRDASTSTDVNNTVITSSFTSEVIEFKSNKSWNLNVWFDGAVVGAPTFTIQGSNATDTNSFNNIECATNIKAPNMVDSLTSTYKYLRVVYTDNGATGGNKYFDFITL